MVTPARSDSRAITRALIVICAGAVMASLDATIANVALARLEHALHSSVAGVQWVLTAYLLTVAAVIPVSGWASRRLGPRRIYVWSLALFGLGSGLCALSSSLGMLIACRALQGVAGGMLIPLSQLIAAEVAGPRQMGKMVSRIWLFTSLAALVGPTLGGVLLQGLGWRWIFLVNVPLSALTTVAALRLLPRTPSRPAGRLDLGGLARLGVGVPATVFALAEAQASGSLTSPLALVPMAVGLALVADFVRHALCAARPLLDVRLFARRAFGSGIATIFCFDLGWYGVLVLLPLSFQQLRGLSPLGAGLLMAPQGLGTALGMWIGGRIQDGARARVLGVGGAFTVVATTLALASFGAQLPIWPICTTLVAAGFAAGLVWVPATAVSYVALARSEISHASPLVAVIMQLGAAFGTAIAAITLQAALAGGAPSPARVARAYQTAFHTQAALALFAALVFAWMCLVLLRRPPVPRRDTAELELAAA